MAIFKGCRKPNIRFTNGPPQIGRPIWILFIKVLLNLVLSTANGFNETVLWKWVCFIVRVEALEIQEFDAESDACALHRSSWTRETEASGETAEWRPEPLHGRLCRSFLFANFVRKQHWMAAHWGHPQTKSDYFTTKFGLLKLRTSFFIVSIRPLKGMKWMLSAYRRIIFEFVSKPCTG